MFGFWSFLPLSTSDTIYYNSEDFGFILYIQQEQESDARISNLISIDMTIQRDNLIIL